MELQEILDKAEEMKRVHDEVEKNTTYSKTKEEIEKVRDKISKLQQKLSILEGKRDRNERKHYNTLEKYPCWWGDTILKPIAEELLKRNPNLKSYNIVGSFGLNAETSIWFFESEEGFTRNYAVENIVGELLFHSGMKVWTGAINKSYSPKSFGALHGDNKIMVETESIEQLNNLLQENIIKTRAERE